MSMDNKFFASKKTVFRIKNRTYATIIQNSDCYNKVLRSYVDEQKLDCILSPRLLERVKQNYAEVLSSNTFSLEDFYATLGLQSDKFPKAITNHKNTQVAKYKLLIKNLIDTTFNQIHKNKNIINVPSVTNTIFQVFQPFSEENRRFSSKQWFLNGNSVAGKLIRKCFEKYTYASIAEKHDDNFCIESLFAILNALKESVDETCRVHCLDSILDYFYTFYFIESESSVDFMIFFPDAFDDIRAFLLSLHDDNPFLIYLDHNYCILPSNCSCLNAELIATASQKLFEEVTQLILRRRLEQFAALVKKISRYSAFNCSVYDITDFPNRSDMPIGEIECAADVVATYKEVLDVPDDFVKNTVKPFLRSALRNMSETALA